MKIGEKLKENRTAAGLSQEALSERIGVSRQTISSWENDRSYPDIGSILKLSDLYSLSLDELLKEDEGMRKHVEKTSEFHETLWTYLFVLTIMLIPLAIVLEQCLNAVTAAPRMPRAYKIRRCPFVSSAVLSTWPRSTTASRSKKKVKWRLFFRLASTPLHCGKHRAPRSASQGTSAPMTRLTQSSCLVSRRSPAMACRKGIVRYTPQAKGRYHRW